jgi:hypothetical protein
VSKHYKLMLSSTDDKIVLTRSREGVPEDITKSIREMEIAILTTLINFAANTYKDFKEINVCMDMLETIENLTDVEDSVILDESDKTHLEKGLEATVGQRPTVWYKCRKFWKQFVNLPEVEIKAK